MYQTTMYKHQRNGQEFERFLNLNKNQHACRKYLYSLGIILWLEKKEIRWADRTSKVNLSTMFGRTGTNLWTISVWDTYQKTLDSECYPVHHTRHVEPMDQRVPSYTNHHWFVWCTIEDTPIIYSSKHLFRCITSYHIKRGQSCDSKHCIRGRKWISTQVN